jgi:hypothetical protein
MSGNNYTSTSASLGANLRAKSFWNDVAVTSMDPRESERRRKLNFRVARMYSVAYADGNDENFLDLIDKDCDFLTLWGVVHGVTAIRVAVAEERRRGVRFLGPTHTAQSTATSLKGTSTRDTGDGSSGSSQAFRQASDVLFEREGWMRQQQSGLASIFNNARHQKLRETIIVRDGKVVSRVMQVTPKTVVYDYV